MNLKWLESKIKLAELLMAGNLGGDYGDAVIILTSIISAIASRKFPDNQGGDRKRFVETWEQFGPKTLTWHNISIPLLLKENDEIDENQIATFNHKDLDKIADPSLVLCGDEIDANEKKVMEWFPQLGLDKIRSYSYGNLVYKDLRCSYSHSLSTSDRSDSFQMDDECHGVSYTNFYDIQNNSTSRRIHFPFSWLKLATCAIVKSYSINPEPTKPKLWSIDAKCSHISIESTKGS